MAPFYGLGSTASNLQSHYEEAVCFLPRTSQKFLVLIWSTLEGWKAELTLEPPIVLNTRHLDWESSFSPLAIAQMYSWVPNWGPIPLIILSIFFHSGHSTQTNFCKQYKYVDFLEISINKRLVCIVLCFVSSCRDANTFCFVLYVSIKNPTYCPLMTSFCKSNRMFDVILWNVFLDRISQMNFMCFADYLSSLLFIYCSISFILFLLNIGV